MGINPKEFYDELSAKGLDLFAGVPDSLLKDFCACVTEDAPSNRNIITANEGNAVGIACGWHIATGRAAVVYMQNSGEGNIVNPLLSIADPDVYSIPMLLVIGWRGEPGVHDEPQHVKQGKVTCALLETMDVPYEILDAESWKTQLSKLLEVMREGSKPVAAVIRKGLFESHKYSPEENGYLLSREEALEALMECLREDDLIVSTTGPLRDVHGVIQRREEGGR